MSGTGPISALAIASFGGSAEGFGGAAVVVVAAFAEVAAVAAPAPATATPVRNLRRSTSPEDFRAIVSS
jgi:hypothetical protein